MNPEELAQQIAKFKSRRHKTRLAYFCTLISLFLTFSSFASGITLYSLASFLLILPLPLYFTLQSYKLTRKSRSVQERLSTQESTCLAPDSPFSFTKFISQPSFAFRLSLLLFFLVFFTTLARTRTPDPTLTLNNQPLTLNH